jgi:hypothetical protein
MTEINMPHADVSVTRRILCGAWALIGLALAAWWVYTVLRAGHVLEYVSLAFCTLAIVGAVLTYLDRRGGPATLKVVAAITLLYSIVFLLFGGLHDRGLIYAGGVGLLALAGVATFALLGGRSRA